jgi:hypothetical protein
MKLEEVVESLDSTVARIEVVSQPLTSEGKRQKEYIVVVWTRLFKKLSQS